MSNGSIARFVARFLTSLRGTGNETAIPRDDADRGERADRHGFAELLAATMHLDFSGAPPDFLRVLDARWAQDAADKKENAR